MQIFEMKKEHIEQVALLEKECFSSPWSVKALEEELEIENAKMIVATIGEKVLGYAGIQIVCGDGFVTNIAVFKSERGNGIGKKLTSKLIDLCENSISLEVRKSNSVAIKLYENLGFEIAGERKNFYSNPEENAVIYTLMKG